MKDRFVVDTCALISYFSKIFNGDISVSGKALEIMDLGFQNNSVVLIYPATVFIEVCIKWFKDEETAAKIRYEVFERIKTMENMEIQPLDKEIIHNYLLIKDIEKEYNFDSHDKQVYASAMTMECPLITSDLHLIRYNNRKGFVKSILK